MDVLKTKAELLKWLAARRGRTRGLVPTMGFLHEGHLSLMRRAAEENDDAIATIFVNPTQFGPNEDLDRYPRDPEGDRARCEKAGITALWMPATDEVYAENHVTTVHVGGPSAGLCGGARPGHFDGVATIVTKLLNLVQPDRAYFGEKDYQQLAVIRRMVRDLDIQSDIIGMPIVRDTDGLALSSRNKYLSAQERADALQLWRALEDARQLWQGGERRPEQLREAILATLNKGAGLRVDYVELVDADELSAAEASTSAVVAALAVFCGTTRLIDNARLDSESPVFKG